MDDLDFGQTLAGYRSGQKIFSRYRLTRLLGRGGMGVVWLATDEELDQEVAMKFLPELMLTDKTALDDLKRETRRSRSLTHPNIVRIHDLVKDERTAAISMEFVDGDTLGNLRVGHASKVFEVGEILPWLPSFFDALDYAHNNAQIVHRDLKPANLMLTAKGELKITDFGISSSVSDSVSRVSAQMGSSGTPVYMSPQQMMGDRPSVTDDLYSLGATLYELLTSRPPFYTGNILLQVQNKVPPSMAQRRAELDIAGADIPEDWEAAIAACLAKEAADRPQSIQDLSERMLGAQQVGFRGRPRSAAASAPVSRAAEAESVNAEPAFSTEQAVQEPVAPAQPKVKTPLTQRQKLAYAGIFLVGLLASLWMADVPHRIKANGLFKDAALLQAGGDSAAAIKLFHQVMGLRPEDPEYRSAYETEQRRYLDKLSQSLAKLQPEPAYAAMQQASQDITPFLDANYSATLKRLEAEVSKSLSQWVQKGLSLAALDAESGLFSSAYQKVEQVQGSKHIYSGFDAAVDKVRATEVRFAMKKADKLVVANKHDQALDALSAAAKYASLVPEYAAQVAKTRDDQVRFEIAQALSLADKGRFEEALKQLGETAKRGLLSETVQEGVSQVKRRAELASVEALCKALQQRDRAQAQKIIDRFSALSGETFRTTAVELDTQTDLQAFLVSLTELKIRPAEGAKRESHFDLVLVESVKGRFSNQAAVQKFLGDSYAEWSRDAAESQMPGTALFLGSLAESRGASLPKDFKASCYAEAARQVGAQVQVTSSQSADSSLSSLADSLSDSLQRTLLSPFASWLGSGSGEGAITLQFQLGRLDSKHEKDESSDSVEYRSGTRERRNPKYAEAQEEVRDARRRLENANEAKSQHDSGRDERVRQAGANASMVAIDEGATAMKDQIDVVYANNQLNNAETELLRTPEMLEEPVYSTEHYTIIDHNLSHTLKASATFSLGRQPVGRTLAWSKEVTERTREVRGNADHGVRVARPSYLDQGTIISRLSSSLQSAVQDTSSRAVLNTALVQFVNQKAAAQKLDAAHKTDLLWSLRELWTQSGASFQQEPELRKLMNLQLGLPSS